MECLQNVNTIVDLLLSGCYFEAKYKCLLLNDVLRFQTETSSNFINSFGCDKSLSYKPLKEVSNRTADSVNCSSQHCPGGKVRLLSGTDLHLPQVEDGVNMIETSIALWASGGDQKLCNERFPDRTKMYKAYEEWEYNKISVYKCSGYQILSNIKFVNTTPFIEFVLNEEFANKITNLTGGSYLHKQI